MKLEKLGPVGPEAFCGSSQVELVFDQLFFVLWRPFPFVGNDTRDSRGNSGIARRSARLGSLIQYLFSLLHS
jgi:hypothetical protein